MGKPGKAKLGSDHSDEQGSLLLAEIYRSACLMHRKADLRIPRPPRKKADEERTGAEASYKK